MREEDRIKFADFMLGHVLDSCSVKRRAAVD